MKLELYYRYRQVKEHFYQIIPLNTYQEKIRIVSSYANDIHKALWYNEVCMYKNASKYLINSIFKDFYFLNRPSAPERMVFF